MDISTYMCVIFAFGITVVQLERLVTAEVFSTSSRRPTNCVYIQLIVYDVFITRLIQ